jgi:hypothetical protein
MNENFSVYSGILRYYPHYCIRQSFWPLFSLTTFFAEYLLTPDTKESITAFNIVGGGISVFNIFFVGFTFLVLVVFSHCLWFRH